MIKQCASYIVNKFSYILIEKNKEKSSINIFFFMNLNLTLRWRNSYLFCKISNSAYKYICLHLDTRFPFNPAQVRTKISSCPVLFNPCVYTYIHTHMYIYTFIFDRIIFLEKVFNNTYPSINFYGASKQTRFL